MMGECIGGIVSATSIPPCILPMHFWMHFFTFPSISSGFLAHWGDRCACGELKVYKAFAAHPPKPCKKPTPPTRSAKQMSLYGGCGGARVFPIPLQAPSDNQNPRVCRHQVTTNTLRARLDACVYQYGEGPVYAGTQ